MDRLANIVCWIVLGAPCAVLWCILICALINVLRGVRSKAPDIVALWDEYETLFWEGYFKAISLESDEKEQARMREIAKVFNELGIELSFSDGDHFYLERKREPDAF